MLSEFWETDILNSNENFCCPVAKWSIVNTDTVNVECVTVHSNLSTMLLTTDSASFDVFVGMLCEANRDTVSISPHSSAVLQSRLQSWLNHNKTERLTMTDIRSESMNV